MGVTIQIAIVAAFRATSVFLLRIAVVRYERVKVSRDKIVNSKGTDDRQAEILPGGTVRPEVLKAESSECEVIKRVPRHVDGVPKI